MRKVIRISKVNIICLKLSLSDNLLNTFSRCKKLLSEILLVSKKLFSNWVLINMERYTDTKCMLNLRDSDLLWWLWGHFACDIPHAHRHTYIDKWVIICEVPVISRYIIKSCNHLNVKKKYLYIYPIIVSLKYETDVAVNL